MEGGQAASTPPNVSQLQLYSPTRAIRNFSKIVPTLGSYKISPAHPLAVPLQKTGQAWCRNRLLWESLAAHGRCVTPKSATRRCVFNWRLASGQKARKNALDLREQRARPGYIEDRPRRRTFLPPKLERRKWLIRFNTARIKRGASSARTKAALLVPKISPSERRWTKANSETLRGVIAFSLIPSAAPVSRRQFLRSSQCQNENPIEELIRTW